MTPPNRFYGPAAPTADKDTRAPRQTPQASAGEATRQVCSVRDCHRPHHARGLCHAHYMREWSQRRAGTGYTSTALPGPTVLPRHPKRIRDALHALAESNPTSAEYERRKAEILKGARP